jgi:hypothetical protein
MCEEKVTILAQYTGLKEEAKGVTVYFEQP